MFLLKNKVRPKKRRDLKGTVSREKYANWDFGGGKTIGTKGGQFRFFFNVPLICHEILKMAPIEVKQNSPVVQEFAIHAHLYFACSVFMCHVNIFGILRQYSIPRALQEYKEKTSNSISPQKTRKQFGPVNEGPKWDSCGQNCEGWKSCDTDSFNF